MSNMELQQFYVVRRSFRSVGNFYEAGTILNDKDLSEIRYAKIKIGEGKIKRWPESDVDQDNMIAYFADRLGVDDLEERIAAKASEGSDVAAPDNQENDTTPPGTDPDDDNQTDNDADGNDGNDDVTTGDAVKAEESKKDEAPQSETPKVEAPKVTPKAAPVVTTKQQPTATKQAQPTTKPKA